MTSRVSRRTLLQAVGTAAIAASCSRRRRRRRGRLSPECRPKAKARQRSASASQRPSTKTACGVSSRSASTTSSSGGPKIPWSEADIRSRMERFKAGGLTLCNLMISGFDDVIWGRPGADAQIADVIASIRAAGKAGLPVVEYNFYANRLMEGYKEETRASRRRLYGLRLFALEGPSAEGRRWHAYTRRAVETRRALSQSRRPGGRESQRPTGAASERPTGADQPRIGTADGNCCALEAVSRSRQESVQRHDVRLRRHAGDGRGSDCRLPISRRTRLHQPRPLQERRRPDAVHRLHRGVSRRRRRRHVRRDEGARAAEVSARDLSRASARARRRPRARDDSQSVSGRRRILRARSTTWATHARCCRRR